jgi:hypothetical protein
MTRTYTPSQKQAHIDAVYSLCQELPDNYRGQSLARLDFLGNVLDDGFDIFEVDERLGLHLEDHGLLSPFTSDDEDATVKFACLHGAAEHPLARCDHFHAVIRRANGDVLSSQCHNTRQEARIDCLQWLDHYIAVDGYRIERNDSRGSFHDHIAYTVIGADGPFISYEVHRGGAAYCEVAALELPFE